MSGFIKYHHIERYGQDAVEGIELGECHIFPKLDGTNASVWLDGEGDMQAGSRNRELSPESDNAGFFAWLELAEQVRFSTFLMKYPHLHLYGEWLVPHTLKTYREDAWKRFWIFDVLHKEDGHNRLLPYEEYAPLLEEFGLDYITPLCITKNADDGSFQKALDQNTFLIQDGKGAGEGITIKNYAWRNKYGHQVWAKIVRNEFKEDNRKTFGVTVIDGKKQVESDVAETFVTQAFVNKTRAKIELETKDRRILIPRLLQTCFHDLVKEEIWDIVKKYKDPAIDFRLLRKHVIYRVKQHAQDIF